MIICFLSFIAEILLLHSQWNRHRTRSPHGGLLAGKCPWSCFRGAEGIYLTYCMSFWEKACNIDSCIIYKGLLSVYYMYTSSKWIVITGTCIVFTPYRYSVTSYYFGKKVSKFSFMIHKHCMPSSHLEYFRENDINMQLILYGAIQIRNFMLHYWSSCDDFNSINIKINA